MRRYAGGAEGNAARKVIARGAALECTLCEWPAGADVSFASQERNFEVIRVMGVR